MREKYDFSGWATKNDLKCSDGRTIRHGAFKDNDGQTVPLVWQHQHNSPSNVLGHALLQNRNEGTYAYCKFNDTDAGKQAKELVQHGDVTALSIYANQLQQKGGDVLHGVIREVSLVLAGANPGALIDYPILAHSGEEVDTEAIIYTGETLALEHADDSEDDTKPEDKSNESDKDEGEKKMAEEKKNDKTVKDVFDSLTEEQKTVVYFMIGQALEDQGKKDDVEHSDMEGNEMKHNVFDGENFESENVLSHAEMETIIADGKRFGSLKESVLQHSEEYGIDHIEYLFPDAKTLNNAPEFIKRNDAWVSKFMNATHHSPFSRIKSVFANITEEDARALGYIKGNMKKEEFFGLIKRVTTPTTVYKKQKLDRDDIVDITDFDVVAWLKTEMRMMLDEEIARAALIGDGRISGSDDKINADCIRPIWTDNSLFTVQKNVNVAANATDDDKAKAFIRQAIKARKDYKGSGSPTLFTTEDFLADMLLLTDGDGRDLFADEAQLAKKLRVKEIVAVPVMEGLTRDNKTLMGIIVNPADYNFGADKGGSVNMFDDFDIDYNQQKYLIETRCSGALTKPYSAIVLEMVVGA